MKETSRHRKIRGKVIGSLPRIVVSAALVVLVLFVCLHLPRIKDTTVALALILVILGIAARWGWLESLIAAAVAGLGFDYYFLPPRELYVQTADNWIALAAFLATAVTASWLFKQALNARLEATQQRDEMAKLYRLVNEMLHGGKSEFEISHLADVLAEIFEANGVAFYDKSSGQVFRAGPRADEIPLPPLLKVADRGKKLQPVDPELSLASIRHAGELYGSIGIRGARLSPSLLEGIAGRLGMGLAKMYATEKAKEAEVAKRSQELKSAVLDALAHEIKNPLNSIKIAATTLLSRPAGQLPSQELLAIIDDEANRLAQRIDEAVQLARVEADQLTLDKEPQDLAMLIPAAIQDMGSLADHRPILLLIPESLPPAECDKTMIIHVLKQLVSNALKYSPRDTPLMVSAEFTGGVVVMNVVDHGPGVAEEERERIFERYYRGRAADPGSPGTGLGLASAKYIVQAHGGDIWVTSPPEGGAAFHVSLPVAGEAH